MSKRQCWYSEGKDCYCKKDDDCLELNIEYARLAYCNDKGCLFNVELPYSVSPDKGILYKPFEEDKYSGVCGRPNGPFFAPDKKTGKTTCRVRSEKKLSHPHFPDADKIEGGSLPDPIDVHAAYHI